MKNPKPRISVSVIVNVICPYYFFMKSNMALKYLNIELSAFLFHKNSIFIKKVSDSFKKDHLGFE